MTQAQSKGEEQSSPKPQWVQTSLTQPGTEFVKTAAEAVQLADGRIVAPMLWTNKTCSDWAPISVHHIRLSRQRMLRPPWKDSIKILHAMAERPGTFILVGSSPYVTRYIDEIRKLAERPGSVVFAINSAVNLVLANNIPLHGIVLFEGGPDNHVKKFKLPALGTPEADRLTIYPASWCHPHQWKVIEGYRAVMWHGWSEVEAQLDEYMKFPAVIVRRSAMHSLRDKHAWDRGVEDRGVIGGGSTTFSRSVNIGFVLGYREFELFGFDSSFEKDGESHYIMSDVGKALPTIDVTPTVGKEIGPTFHCKPFMARQAWEFLNMLASQTPNASPNPWLHIKNRVRMHGPGLLPWMHRTRFPQHYEGVNV